MEETANGDRKTAVALLDAARPKAAKTQVYRKRWIILLSFCLLSLSNAFQWIEYSIIADIVKNYYGIPYVAVDWLSMIYMLAYIPLVVPATWVLDKFGLRLVALLGAFGNCFGAWLKCASADPNRFFLTFIGQTITGSSQIFILGIPPRLAAVWFGPTEVSTACAVGVFGNQIGIAIGFLVPPMIVPNSANIASVTRGFEVLFFSVAIITSVVFLLVFLVFTDSPPLPPSSAQLSAIQTSTDTNFAASLKSLMTNRNYVLLLITYGINVGAFYVLSTLLSQMLTEYYKNEEENIGRIGLLIVLAGMLGSLVSGLWLDKTHMFKFTTVFVYAFSFTGMLIYTFTLDKGLWIVFLVAGFLGFFMTGYLALGFEFGNELTYPISEGTVSGLLNASAQVFGVIMTLGMGQFIHSVSVFACNITLSACLLAGTVVTIFIKSDLRRQRAGKMAAEEEAADAQFILSPSTVRILTDNDSAGTESNGGLDGADVSLDLSNSDKEKF